MKHLDTINANNFKITNLATPTVDTDAATKEYVDDNGGGSADHAYYARLAALLEPDAIEPINKGTFAYVVASNETKYLLASWQTRIGSAGRMEVRDPREAMPLRGVTLNGTGSDSAAITLDPTLPTYADARTTYFDRMEILHTSQLKTLDIEASNTRVRFLPGPYGSVILRAVNFDFAWIIIIKDATWGINLGNEISDSASQRIDRSLYLPVDKKVTNGFQTASASTGAAKATLVYVHLPSTWSEVTDPLAPYDFRDDFMGTTLDTGVWTRAQSTAGNVEIDTQHQWLKMTGNNSWGTNGLYRTTGIARSSQPYLLLDVFVAASSLSPVIVGWHDGGGHSYTDFAHGLFFSDSGALKVFENGNDRGTVGSGYTYGATYRVRIRALSGGGATYEIQGGAQYDDIGSATWDDVTPGTTTSATNTLHVGASTPHTSLGVYLSDPRVYTP